MNAADFFTKSAAVFCAGTLFPAAIGSRHCRLQGRPLLRCRFLHEACRLSCGPMRIPAIGLKSLTAGRDTHG